MPVSALMMQAIRNGASTVTAAAPPPAAFDPSTIFGVSDVGGYWTTASLSDMKQLSNGTTAVTVADGSQVVGYVAEKSGKGLAARTLGHDFVGGPDGTYRPTLNSSGGINYLAFDGSNDFLADTRTNDNTAGTRYVLPASTGWTRVSVLRTISGSDLSGNAIQASSGAGYDGGYLKISNTLGENGRLFMQAGVVGPKAPTSITGSGSTFFVVIEEFHGASSSIQVDNGSVITADAGSTNGGGIILGTGVFSGAGRMDWVETLVIGRLLTTTEKNNLRTKFGADIGKTL
jgi:hypothetical protein